MDEIKLINHSESTLCAAEKVAHDDPYFLSLSNLNYFTGRVRFNRVIAMHVTYIRSSRLRTEISMAL